MAIKKGGWLIAIAVLLLNRTIAQEGFVVADVVAKKATPFSLHEVRLLNSPFRHAMEKDAAWLLTLDPDRFLHRFRENAGLKPKGKIYGGWESRGVSGHSLGHYLSACAMMYAATGDVRFKAKTDYIITELAECQAARKTGYVGAIPDEDRVWNEVAAGDIRSPGFDLNGAWVPWYTVHKVLAGLIDTYLYTANKEAKTIAVKFCDWIDVKFKALSEAQFQKMLDCEQGGMNEALANVYALTADKKYLALSYRFNHKKIIDSLANGKDVLPGLHANTQIPKIIGTARQYELTGNAANRATSHFFWNTVVHHYSYVIGGNSDGERFSNAPDHLADHLSANSTETCNSYNMLKLTSHLYELEPDAAFMDYYERTLYNHILASQNPENGMVLYYLPLAPGAQKIFGTPDESFWCCTGTGMENHARYGQDIYCKEAAGGLFVNLFIPSVLTWKEKGLTLQLDTRYPESDTVRLTINGLAQNGLHMPLHIRRPAWAGEGANLTINGKPLTIESAPGSYFTVDKNWKKGDVVQLIYPMKLYTESMPDNAAKKAVLYGPLVLAGRLGKAAVSKRDLPVFVTADAALSTWIKPDAVEPNVFYASNNGNRVQLAPLYKVFNEKQAVYWDFFSAPEWKQKQRQFEEERKAEAELDARTLDVFRVGEMQPERDHYLKGERTNTGDVEGVRWRDATDGGWFSFTLQTKGEEEAELQCNYWGADGEGREFSIMIDGQNLAAESLRRQAKPGIYAVSYPIPASLLRAKGEITVRFQALPGKTAGGLFGCRLLKTKKN